MDAAASAREAIAGRVFVSDRPARGRTTLQWTAKSCGPGTRCWCQVSRRRYRPSRASDAPFNRRGDGGKKELVAGENAKETVKTIAQGRPDDPPVPVVLPRAFCLHADHGCGGHPAFPAPSVLSRAVRFQQLGRFMPRERGPVSAIMSRPILRDAACRPPLTMRSSQVARVQPLMVRAAEPRVSGRCFASPRARDLGDRRSLFKWARCDARLWPGA